MSGSGVATVGNAINSWVDTSNDNITQALQYWQQSKQFDEQMGLEREKNKREWERWNLERLRMMNDIAQGNMDTQWRRDFRNALMRGSSAGAMA